MSKLYVKPSDVEMSARMLVRAGDYLRSALGAVTPRLSEAVAAMGGEPAAAAMAMFGDVLSEVVLSLADGLADVGSVSAMASALYESTDATAMDGR